MHEVFFQLKCDHQKPIYHQFLLLKVSQALLVILIFHIFVLAVVFALTSKRHLSALFFIRLSLNHLNKPLMGFSKERMNSSSKHKDAVTTL